MVHGIVLFSWIFWLQQHKKQLICASSLAMEIYEGLVLGFEYKELFNGHIYVQTSTELIHWCITNWSKYLDINA